MKSILVVEDERSLRNVLAAFLRDKGYEVVTAADGQQALDALRRQPFDLAVVDLMIPGVKGQALVAAIRADDRLAGLPVIVLTATVSEPLEQAMRGSVQGWLTKTTVSLAEIECLIRTLTGVPPTTLGGVPGPKPRSNRRRPWEA